MSGTAQRATTSISGIFSVKDCDLRVHFLISHDIIGIDFEAEVLL